MASSYASHSTARAYYVKVIIAPPVTDSYSFILPNPPVVQSYITGDYFNAEGYTFFNESDNGGFVNAPTGIYYQGEQLYSGPESNPVFSTGFYDLINNNFDIVATVAITTLPEPSTWVLMALGFGSLAFAGHRRMLKEAPGTPSA